MVQLSVYTLKVDKLIQWMNIPRTQKGHTVITDINPHVHSDIQGQETKYIVISMDMALTRQKCNAFCIYKLHYIIELLSLSDDKTFIVEYQSPKLLKELCNYRQWLEIRLHRLLKLT